MPEERWRELYLYWRARHVGGQPPSRADIDPILDIPRLVANLVLMDIEGDTYRYRVAGSDIEARAGMALAGRVIGIPNTLPQVLADWRRILDITRDDGKPHLYYSRVPEHLVAKYVTLVLPLIDAAGAVEMLLVGSFYDQYVEPGTQLLEMAPVEITL
jgi:hypothetical protein